MANLRLVPSPLFATERGVTQVDLVVTHLAAAGVQRDRVTDLLHLAGDNGAHSASNYSGFKPSKFPAVTLTNKTRQCTTYVEGGTDRRHVNEGHTWGETICGTN